MTKLYQVWKGSNIFCLWGRFIFGPDVKSLILSFFLICSSTSLFLAFVVTELSRKLPGGWVLWPFSVALVLWDIFLLLFTASRDPGIVPRNAHPPDPDPNDETELDDGPSGRRLPRTKDVVVNGHVVKVKYCDTCMLYRPPRCSHCSICNNCIERFDHHCPWVGQCIGKRNYRYFFLFVSSTTLLCVYVLALSVLNVALLVHPLRPRGGALAEQGKSIWGALAASPVSLALMAFTFLIVWFVGGLTAFHSFLLSTNQTTYENFRARYDKKPNPYDRGWLRNVMETLCSAIPASRNHFRGPASSSSPKASVEAPGPASAPNSHGHNNQQQHSHKQLLAVMSKAPSRTSSGSRSPNVKDYMPLGAQRLADELRQMEEGARRKPLLEPGSARLAQLRQAQAQDWAGSRLGSLGFRALGAGASAEEDGDRVLLRGAAAMPAGPQAGLLGFKTGVLTQLERGDKVFTWVENPLAKEGYFFDDDGDDDDDEASFQSDAAQRSDGGRLLGPVC